MIIKFYLITFYYLIEIIKSREKLEDNNKIINKLNNIVKDYNRIIAPYKEHYNKILETQKSKTYSVGMKEIELNIKKLVEDKFNINWNDVKHYPPNEIFSKCIKIINKRHRSKLVNTKHNIIKPVVNIKPTGI